MWTSNLQREILEDFVSLAETSHAACAEDGIYPLAQCRDYKLGFNSYQRPKQDTALRVRNWKKRNPDMVKAQRRRHRDRKLKAQREAGGVRAMQLSLVPLYR